MTEGEWILFTFGAINLAFGVLMYLSGHRVRKTKKRVRATRWTAWVENVKDEDVEKEAKNSFFIGVGLIVIGLVIWAGLIYLLLS